MPGWILLSRCFEILVSIQDFLSLKIFDRDVLVSEDRWHSKGHRESLDAFATAITKQLDGHDPYGFFASSRKVLEIDQELRGVSAPERS